MKILAVQYRSALTTTIFVAYDTEFNGEWNSVVGTYMRPRDAIDALNLGLQLPKYDKDQEEMAKQFVAMHGAKIEWQLAQILFPDLDITKHKYYSKKTKGGDKK